MQCGERCYTTRSGSHTSYQNIRGRNNIFENAMIHPTIACALTLAWSLERRLHPTSLHTITSCTENHRSTTAPRVAKTTMHQAYVYIYTKETFVFVSGMDMAWNGMALSSLIYEGCKECAYRFHAMAPNRHGILLRIPTLQMYCFTCSRLASIHDNIHYGSRGY